MLVSLVGVVRGFCPGLLAGQGEVDAFLPYLCGYGFEGGCSEFSRAHLEGVVVGVVSGGQCAMLRALLPDVCGDGF